MPKRHELLQRLRENTYDLVVVGGGITGCGVAKDAARRGLKVALVEARDVGFGTSSRSSKLIHGGLRYLKQMEFSLVWESVNERRLLERLAPHLVVPQSFLFSVYKQSPLRFWTLKLGLWIYEALVLFRVPKLHRSFRQARVAEEEPLLENTDLKGAGVYWDCTTNDSRLTLETALDAQMNGVDLVTYCRVTGFNRGESGEIEALQVVDELQGGNLEIKTACVVNATGPWTDQTRALLGRQGRLLRPTKGIHIVVSAEKLSLRHANVLHHPEDDRILFAVPWGDVAYVGTTDTDYQGLGSEVAATAEDVDYLLRSCDRFFPTAGLTREDVQATWSGLRPLISEEEGEASSVSREHQVIAEDDGLVTVAGGKLTTFRRMAEEVVDACLPILQNRGLQRDLRKAHTASAVFPGAVGWSDWDSDEHRVQAVVEASDGILDVDSAALLVQENGTIGIEIAALVRGEPGLGRRLMEGRAEVMAQVVWGVKREFAMTLCDVMVRRTQLFFKAKDQGLSVARDVAERMASMLDWDSEEIERQIADYKEEVARSRQWQKA